jgi:hypothetical protein
MNLQYYIIAKGKRKLFFENANLLDNFVRNKKSFPKDAKIVIKENDKFFGEILVERYLQLCKNEAIKENN